MIKRLRRFLVFSLILTLWSGEGRAFYTEIYDQRVEDTYETAPSLDVIGDKEKHRGTNLTGEVLADEAKDYIFWCAETNFETEALENLYYDETPDNEQERRGDLTKEQYFNARDKVRQACLKPQFEWYERQVDLKHAGARLEEKQTPFFDALRQNITVLHGPQEAAKVTDFTYYDESGTDLSPELPQNLYPEGRPLKPGSNPEQGMALQAPGEGRGEGGMMQTLAQMISLLQEVNKTPKKAQQVPSTVFESTLAAPGRTFGDHYSRPFFFLESVADVSHYPLFDPDQYDHDIWAGVSDFVDKIIEEDDCELLVEQRIKDKNIDGDGARNLVSRCEEFRKALFAEDLRREAVSSEMKQLFMRSKYLGKQLTRDVENYEQLAYLINQIRQVTDNMAQNKPSIAEGEKSTIKNLWEEIFWVLLTTDAYASSLDREDLYDQESGSEAIGCENFTKMQALVEKARTDLNEMQSIEGRKSAENESKFDHSTIYNEILQDDYQLQLQYHKMVNFPQELVTLFDEYYHRIGEMDTLYHGITTKDKGLKGEAYAVLKPHLDVVNRLLPSVILAPSIIDQSLLRDTREEGEFDEMMGEGFEVNLTREFDWARLRYCKDDEIFAHLGVENPQELTDILQEIPDNFNGYTNSKLVQSDIVDRADIRARRRAPSMGTYNPQTYCHSQLDTIKTSQEGTEEENFWTALVDQAEGIFKRIFGQADEQAIENFDAYLDEENKEQARLRRGLHRADLNCMTHFHQKLYEFDQFHFEMTYHERFTHALKPIIDDSNAILNNLKYICTLHNVDLGCPL